MGQATPLQSEDIADNSRQDEDDTDRVQLQHLLSQRCFGRLDMRRQSEKDEEDGSPNATNWKITDETLALSVSR